MAVENTSTIGGLQANWPLGSDPKSEGDNHIRLIKAVLQSDALSISATGEITIQASLILPENLTVQGSFTSQGIDDNATERVVALTDTGVRLGPDEGNYALYRNADAGLLTIAGGGASSLGAKLIMGSRVGGGDLRLFRDGGTSQLEIINVDGETGELRFYRPDGSTESMWIDENGNVLVPDGGVFVGSYDFGSDTAYGISMDINNGGGAAILGQNRADVDPTASLMWFSHGMDDVFRVSADGQTRIYNDGTPDDDSVMRREYADGRYGVRTVSTSAPSGGNDGDLWYQVD